MVQRTSLIDSNNTQLNSDYDFTKLMQRFADDSKGVLFSDLSSKPEFDLDLGTGELQPGTAIIQCTRTASQPIGNQTFYALFQSSSVETLNVSVGQKIFIEINNSLIQNPVLIEDTPPSTDFAQGLNIGEIKSNTSYPSHSNYIPLYEITSGPTKVDLRDYPQIKGDLADLSNLTQSIITSGNVEGANGVFSGIVTAIRAYQASYLAPIADREFAPKKYVDDQIALSTGVEQLLDKDTYRVGEDVTAGDVLFPEVERGYEDIDRWQNVGDVSGNTRVVKKIFMNGVSGDDLKLAVGYKGTPSVDFGFRVETPSGSEPSGTLVDANATGSVAIGSLTDCSEVTDANGNNHSSTTSNDGAGGYRLQANGDIRINSLELDVNVSGATRAMVKNDDGMILEETTNLSGTTFTFSGNTVINSGDYFRVEVDDDLSNYTRARDGSASFPSGTNFDYITGSLRGLNNSDGYNIVSIDTELIPADESLTFNGSFSYDGPCYLVLFQGTYGSETVNASNYFIVGYNSDNTTTRGTVLYDGSSYGTIDEDKFIYTDSSMMHEILLSLADATYQYKLPFKIRVATETESEGENVICTTYGINENFSGLSYDGPVTYFLQDTPGTVGTSEGTNRFIIGHSISDTKLYVDGGEDMYVPGENYNIISDDDAVYILNSSGSTAVMCKSIEVDRDFLYNVYFQIEEGVGGPSYSGTFTIYKNGVSVGTPRTTTGISWVGFSEYIEASAGDTIEIWGYTSDNDYQVGVRNFRLRGDRVSPQPRQVL